MSATNALLYLHFTTLRNALVQRVVRLRQPKYLLGALAGLAYFWFFVFRNLVQPRHGLPADSPAGAVPAELGPLLPQLASVVLLIIVALNWLLPSRRAALAFTEAQVAFLFPAPVTRRTLIEAQLLRSQFSILISAFFLTLFLGRGRGFGGNVWTHAIGWWLILSTLNLHFLGASFFRERLLGFGIGHLRRRLLVLAALGLLGAVSWFGLRHTVILPTEADLNGLASISAYAERTLGSAPLRWILAPFALVVRPYLSVDGPAFLAALGPAVLLLLAHYYWVIRSDVAFEEASLEASAKLATRVAALREGRWRSRQLPTKPRPEPFRLAPTGWTPTAYLWKSLIALGPFYRLRTWLIACAVAVAGLTWLGSASDLLPFKKVFGVSSIAIGGMGLLYGPLILRGRAGQILQQLDVTKSYPLAGWTVVLGELLTPMVLMTFIEWFLLFVAVLAFDTSRNNLVLTAALSTGGALGVALLIPPLCGLLSCVAYAGVLFFPAWATTAGSQGGGVEVVGQRLIYTAGYLVVLVVALLPAAIVGAVVFIITNWLAGQVVAVILTALIASVVIGGELAATIWWLGEKVDRFDLSTELPR